MPINGIKIFAHRGARKTSPENTLEAIARARESGADGFECDVKLTRDGEPVIFHDRELKRTTGKDGSFDLTSWKELRELRVFGNYRIPHLDEVLQAIHDWPQAEVFFDLHQRRLDLVEILVKRIAAAGLLSRCMILDFYRERQLLLHARTIHPQARISVMPGHPKNILPSLELGFRSMCIGWDKPWTTFLYKTACLFYDAQSYLKTARELGTDISGGLANTPGDIRYFLSYGVDGIWTDDLNMAVKFLGTLRQNAKA